MRQLLRRWVLPWIPLIVLSGQSIIARHAYSAEEDRLTKAIEVLEHSKTGRGLLEKAMHVWAVSEPKGLREAFKWGVASRTDAVLTRHFDPSTGTESRERQITIFLRSSQTLSELVLDMAHELVHATSQPAWDPYDPKLTAGRYIQAAIEGEGGEVEAVLKECQVGLELNRQFGTPVYRCSDYGLHPKREEIERDFYKVGKWNHQLFEQLGNEAKLLPLLSADNPKLYSSTGHAPYPLALYREFIALTEIACQNSRKRIHNMGERAPASENAFVSERCH